MITKNNQGNWADLFHQGCELILIYTPVASKCYALGDLIFLFKVSKKASNSQPYCEFLDSAGMEKAIDLKIAFWSILSINILFPEIQSYQPSSLLIGL